jgi:hypothetical protein
MTQRAIARRFCLVEIVREQLEPSWSPLSSLASHPTIQRTSKNSLVPLRLSFQPKTKLKRSRLQTIRRLDLGGQFTQDIERAKRVASRVETGMVFINYPDVSWPDLLFGGIKRSGYGKELSNLGLEEFVNKKLVLVPNIPAENR